jgi:thiol-disulfide isomerase/thioredoxin
MMASIVLTEYCVNRIKNAFLLLLVLCPFQNFYTQSINIGISGYKGSVYLSGIAGEKTTIVDSMISGANGDFKFTNSNRKLDHGLYRLSFDNNKWVDFVYDDENISISTSLKSITDSLKILQSESNKLFYAFLKLNKDYKTKTGLLQYMLDRYPQDDIFYKTTRDRMVQIQNEYLKFIDSTSRRNPDSFTARYIKSSQLPAAGYSLTPDERSVFLKTHALDNIDFNDGGLIFSDLFSNKTIEYLTYYSNPQLPKEHLEKIFTEAIDTLLNKAKVNYRVYKQIVEYLIEGFKKFGFEDDLEYVVNNYVVKDDLCLDNETEVSIENMINQMKILHAGAVVPNIIMQDTSGNEIELDKIKSDKILIVFYASWCPHCKAFIPKLADYVKNKKLKVLAISLDNNRNDWISFIKNNNMDWLNVRSDKGWDCKAAKDYYIYATPAIFLVDKDKKIIGKPLTIEELKNKLKL